jgi:hypothetical protein
MDHIINISTPKSIDIHSLFIESIVCQNQQSKNNTNIYINDKKRRMELSWEHEHEYMNEDLVDDELRCSICYHPFISEMSTAAKNLPMPHRDGHL